jgi:hypothetical protein
VRETRHVEKRYAVPVEQTGWQLPGRESTVAFTWQYDTGRERMLNLYQKGKDKQWDSVHRIDWSHEIDPTDTSGPRRGRADLRLTDLGSALAGREGPGPPPLHGVDELAVPPR